MNPGFQFPVLCQRGKRLARQHRISLQPPMSFPFVPRTVAKRKAAHNATVKVNTLSGSLPATSQPNASSKGKEKAPEGPSAEECAILFSLALSEYALWKDSDLRMKLDEDGCEYLSSHYFNDSSSSLVW